MSYDFMLISGKLSLVGANLRVKFQGGHGMGSTQQQFNEEYADEFAFLCQQMEVKM
jgi:prolyl oligopeptidase PreP (S9A serine peptidase family)